MQNTTADYKLEIIEPSRVFECKITIGNNIYTNSDVTNLVLEYTQPKEGFTIGNTISQSLDLTLLNRGDIIYSTSQIKLEIGLKIGDKIEYIPMGIFNIDDIEKTDYTTKFTAYDNMIKFETAYYSELGDNPTLQQVVNELASKTGIEFTGSLPAYTVSKLEGFTCRNVLSYVASICGGNAIITRDGKFTIKELEEVEKTINGRTIFLNNYTKEEIKYKVGQVSCQVSEGNILSKGSTGTDSMEVQFENPWVTESILNEIYNKLKSVEYLGYSMKWHGDIALDPYDIVTVTDAKNVTRKLPILSQKFTFYNGITSEIGAKGETKNKNDFSSGGSLTDKLNRTIIEQAIIKEAIIEKANIKDVEAVSIRTQNLEAKTAKIEEAIIGVAHIEDLNAINANIEKLIAADATINNALIGKADITELNAVQGNITALNSQVANIQTLVNGNLSSENIQVGGITGANLNMDTIFVKDANMVNVNINSLKAGDFSATKFRIVSDSGNMLISDNTIQIRDNNRVRVQIGKDTSNDYNMYVWDSAGKLMFDATGLKADGIKNKIIRDDMISDNANIDGAKLNISSLITEINKDTNTSVIKSSKVQLDTVGQTLEVAFNSLKSNVDNIEIGGRNLLKGTSDKYKEYTMTSWNCLPYAYTLSELGLKVGDKVAFKLSLKFGDTPCGGSARITFYNSAGTNIKSVSNSVFIKATSEGYSEILTTIPNDAVKIAAGVQREVAGSGLSTFKFELKEAKLEIGTKCTTWTPAIEDIDSSIEAVKQITESNSTTINVMQGQISTAINNTQIVKDGQTILLKDDYNRTVSLVNSINSTIGTHTTKIDELSGNITSVDTKVNSVQRDLEGTKSTVSSNSTSITDLSSKVSTQGASISQLQNEIKLKVEQTDITKAIDNIEIGVRNLAQKTSSKYSNAYTSFNGSTNTCPYLGQVLTDGLSVGDKVTVRLIYKYTDIVTVSGKVAKCWIQGSGDVTSWSSGTFGSSAQKVIDGSGEIEFNYSFTINENHLKNKFWNTSIRHDYVQSGSVQWKMFKVEKGTKATSWSPALEDVDSSIANVQTQVTTTSNKVATIETNLSSITQRVSATETTTATLTTNVTKAQSTADTALIDANKTPGLTNLLRNGNFEFGLNNWSTHDLTGDTGSAKSINILASGSWCPVGKKAVQIRGTSTTGRYGLISSTIKLMPNSYYTISGYCAGHRVGNIQVNVRDLDSSSANIVTKNYTPSNGGNTLSKWYRFEITFQTTANTNFALNLYSIDLASDGYVWFTDVQIQEGEKATAWTKCQADYDATTEEIKTTLTTTSNKVSTIETNLNSITSRVSSVESTTTTINGNITNLQSRMTTAEQKITPTAITTTISEVITGGTGSISTTQFVMDKNGLTIKNGALTIQNKAGTTVFDSDTNGNLIVTGTLKSQSGAQFVSMSSGGIDFQDWNKNEQMLRIGISYFDSNRDMNGVNFALAKYGDFIRFSHVAKADLTNGWTSSDTQYNFFDCWSGDQTVGDISYKKGINVYAPIYINNGLKLYSGTTHWAEILGAVSWNNGTGTVSNMLGLYGDNGAVLGYKSGENLQARFIVTESAHPGTGDNLISFGNYNFNGYTFHNANIVAKSLSVSGSKNCLQETESYGARLINAYETAEYYFGDLGFGKINEAGECLAYIDDIFLECVNTNAQYHVFTQIYNGKITSIERYTTYVVIKGEPGTNFSWQLMGKRRGYENNRLETQEIETQGENKIELFGYEDFKVETSEDTLMDVLTFELEDLLLMEG